MIPSARKWEAASSGPCDALNLQRESNWPGWGCPSCSGQTATRWLQVARYAAGTFRRSQRDFLSGATTWRVRPGIGLRRSRAFAGPDRPHGAATGRTAVGGRRCMRNGWPAKRPRHPLTGRGSPRLAGGNWRASTATWVSPNKLPHTPGSGDRGLSPFGPSSNRKIFCLFWPRSLNGLGVCALRTGPAGGGAGGDAGKRWRSTANWPRPTPRPSSPTWR